MTKTEETRKDQLRRLLAKSLFGSTKLSLPEFERIRGIEGPWVRKNSPGGPEVLLRLTDHVDEINQLWSALTEQS